MDFIPCEKCNNGWIIENDEALKCSCLQDYQNKIRDSFLIENCNLPKSINNYSIRSYIGPDINQNISKLIKYIEEFENKFKEISLYVFGSNATQKTTVLSWCGLEIAKKGFSVLYITMQNLIKDLCNEQYKEELNEIIEKYNSMDLLILDESWDKQKLTLYRSGYQLPFIDDFLRKRIEKNKKATIFISNISIKDMHDDFGLSLKSLIERNCRNTQLEFLDNINLKNNFEVKDMWSNK